MQPVSRRTFVKGLSVAAMAARMARGEAASSGAWRSDWREQAVLDTRRSPHAKLHGVPVRAVTLGAGHWTARRATNVKSSIPTMQAQMEHHGRMDNFRRLVGQSKAPQRGPLYSDSDVYKWMEAVAWAQQSDPQYLRAEMDALTKLILSVQEPSGYINTYFIDDRRPLRMTTETQKRGHELYCMGHLTQAAVAQYRATGDARLLEACVKFVDHFLIPGYGPGAAQTPIVSGHPEIEMALIEMYRITGDRRHLDMAGYILAGDERNHLSGADRVYLFSGSPFVKRTRLEGHAVRAMYACCGATDYYMETGDASYLATLMTLWKDLARAQMYVTGGVGAREQGESFGEDYELPNMNAYGESCAAIGNMMWNWRMLHATGDARHMDIVERALYNGIDSGMSLDGTTYCYRNPLAYDPTNERGAIRNPWYDTTCCPPNLERTLSSLPGYFYSTDADGLYVHLFHDSAMEWKLESGVPLKVTQATEYPWDGRVRMTVSPAQATKFALRVRVPGWSRETSLRVNGARVDGVKAASYAEIARVWKPGDVVEAEFAMEPQLIVADRRVAEDQGRVAVQRGPVVYCAEALDQPGKAAPRELRVAADAKFAAKHELQTLGGITVLEQSTSRVQQQTAGEALYGAMDASSREEARMRLIPYYAWANREPAEMAVWLGLETKA